MKVDFVILFLLALLVNGDSPSQQRRNGLSRSGQLQSEGLGGRNLFGSFEDVQDENNGVELDYDNELDMVDPDGPVVNFRTDFGNAGMDDLLALAQQGEYGIDLQRLHNQPVPPNAYQDPCSICYGQMMEGLNDADDLRPVALDCQPIGHVYHKQCILQWFAIQKNCPQCRDDKSSYEVPQYDY